MWKLKRFTHCIFVLILALQDRTVQDMIRQSDIDALESVVLDGHGGKLIGEELPTTADNKTRAFLRNVPEYLVSTQCGNYRNLLSHFYD